eukprot:1134448-Lingulodinium_polyedra.AAC.1
MGVPEDPPLPGHLQLGVGDIPGLTVAELLDAVLNDFGLPPSAENDLCQSHELQGLGWVCRAGLRARILCDLSHESRGKWGLPGQLVKPRACWGQLGGGLEGRPVPSQEAEASGFGVWVQAQEEGQEPWPALAVPAHAPTPAAHQVAEECESLLSHGILSQNLGLVLGESGWPEG